MLKGITKLAISFTSFRMKKSNLDAKRPFDRSLSYSYLKSPDRTTAAGVAGFRPGVREAT
jgi:hypothetical protein